MLPKNKEKRVKIWKIPPPYTTFVTENEYIQFILFYHMKKLYYEAPSMELFVLAVEQGFALSGEGNESVGEEHPDTEW